VGRDCVVMDASSRPRIWRESSEKRGHSQLTIAFDADRANPSCGVPERKAKPLAFAGG
jgi:hypothetical protein